MSPNDENEKTGRYLREGKWQILIRRSYKPIVVEARKSADKIYNRIMTTHLLMDDEKDNKLVQLDSI